MGMPTAERGTPMPDVPLLLQIFLSFIKIDILCFGGAYAAVPVVQQQVVEVKGWMTTSEFMDLLAIDELTPGPIVVNCATFVGNKLAGVPGGIVATMGCVLPTALIALALVRLYLRYRDAQVMEDALTGIKSVVAALLLPHRACCRGRRLRTHAHASLRYHRDYYWQRRLHPAPLYVCLVMRTRRAPTLSL